MLKNKIIGFAGGKQQGKDSSADFAEIWLKIKNKSFDRRAFADPLKQYCVDVLGLNAKELWGTDEDKNKPTKYLWDNLPLEIRIRHQKDKFLRWVNPRTGPMSNRDILNIVGTDIHRNYFGDNIWIDALFNKDYSQKDFLIITDIRTFEEIDSVKSRNGTIIKLERQTGLRSEHEIQKRLERWTGADYNVDNNGSLEDLQVKIYEILGKII